MARTTHKKLSTLDFVRCAIAGADPREVIDKRGKYTWINGVGFVLTAKLPKRLRRGGSR